MLLDRALTDALNLNEVIILAASVVLAFVCFIDDLRGMSALFEVNFSNNCILPGLLFLFETGGLFREWMAPEFDVVVTGIIWLWFIKLVQLYGWDRWDYWISGYDDRFWNSGLSATGIITEQVLGPSIVFLAAAFRFPCLELEPSHRVFRRCWKHTTRLLDRMVPDFYSNRDHNAIKFVDYNCNFAWILFSGCINNIRIPYP